MVQDLSRFIQILFSFNEQEHKEELRTLLMSRAMQETLREHREILDLYGIVLEAIWNSKISITLGGEFLVYIWIDKLRALPSFQTYEPWPPEKEEPVEYFGEYIP